VVELLREWVVGVSGAAVLSALALTLTPEVGPRRVVKLVCGLLLLLAVVLPIARLGGRGFRLDFSPPELDERTAALYEAGQSALDAIIQERTSAYSGNDKPEP
jgi:stage III sporulation protein AF